MRLGDWLDERTGHRAWWKRLADHPTFGPPSWGRAVSAALTACLLLELTTGVALMTAYAPETRSAWASVHFIQRMMPYGWLVRGLHRTTTDVLVVLVGAQIFALAVRGAYRRPREVTFWLALAQVLLVMGAAITGGLLPWDQLGWWARSVEANIAAMAPGGPALLTRLLGGGQIGNLALARAYAVHVAILPLAFFLVWRARRGIDRRHAFASPARRKWYPGQAARDLALATFAFAVIALMVQRSRGAPLGPPADPASDYPARPEWFLMWMFELRHRMPKSLELWGTALGPALLGLLVAALPLFDRRSAFEDRGPAFRIRALVPLLLVFGVIGYLTQSAVRRDQHDAELRKSLAKWDQIAKRADSLAMKGVPPEGPLAMLERDPELRGEALFSQRCGGCHLLGELGDPRKARAPALDGWSTEAWIALMMHDPDGESRFGRTAYKNEMPSVDVPPKDKPDFQPMSKEDIAATAAFLASLGEDPPPSGDFSRGEKIVSERCTTCHLYKGEGDDGGQGLAPELAGYGSVAWVRAQIANPATKATYRENALDPKLEGHMPRFDDDLGPADLDLLARWVRNRARSSKPRP